MALKRCMVIEMRWKRKRLARSSPLDELMRRPRALRKSTAELFRTPVFSTAIGWNRYDCDSTEYLLIFATIIINIIIIVIINYGRNYFIKCIKNMLNENTWRKVETIGTGIDGLELMENRWVTWQELGLLHMYVLWQYIFATIIDQRWL